MTEFALLLVAVVLLAAIALQMLWNKGAYEKVRALEKKIEQVLKALEDLEADWLNK